MKIILATNNEGKVKEFKKMLMAKNLNYSVLSLKDVDFNEDIEEFGETLYQNALIKVEAVAKKFPQSIIIADDSGLFIESLDEAPGVYSARYGEDVPGYKKNKDLINCQKILKNMKQIKNRRAYFQTVICLKIPGNNPYFYDGKLLGEIAEDIKLGNGFGYDPIFISMGRRLSEITVDEKNCISHRAKALDNMLNFQEFIKIN